jgi:hypothetical protein
MSGVWSLMVGKRTSRGKPISAVNGPTGDIASDRRLYWFEGHLSLAASRNNDSLVPNSYRNSACFMGRSVKAGESHDDAW